MDKNNNHTNTEKKLFIETYGCQMNVADSEVVASVMQMEGYRLTENLKEADAVFVNTCSIRDNAEQRVVQRLEYLNAIKKQKKGKMIIGVLGCMAERAKTDLIDTYKADIVIGPMPISIYPTLSGWPKREKKPSMWSCRRPKHIKMSFR
jgi:tRNA-2-methylthio-N6-dimethylallyladenosine synthase